MEAAATTTSVTYGGEIQVPDKDTAFDTTVLMGKKESIQSIIDQDNTLENILGNNGDDDDDAMSAAACTKKIISAMMEAAKPKSATTSFLPSGKRLSLCVLPEKVSRNNHPMSVHTITNLVASTCNGKGNTRLLFCGTSSGSSNDEHSATPSNENEQCATPGILASAFAKAFPLYSRKTTGGSNNGSTDDGGDEKDSSSDEPTEKTVHVSFFDAQGQIVTDPTCLTAARVVTDGVRMAARLVDTMPEELTTTVFAEECRQLVQNDFKDRGVTMTELVGDELRESGYGGLYGVGKAATCPPRLIILEYTPPPDSSSSSSKTETVALVGKGILYDTGGLALKTRTGMCGMKGDMGGSAGLLGAFHSAVRLQVRQKITLLLCVAENAIGPAAFRNDDILTLYSGKTVEINNSDAEGRLVLGDGVAHATKHIDGLDLVVDMATLTGAQLICTGKKHAGILANTEELEERAFKAGKRSGDLVFPMVYAPELLKEEFDSKVADMKNSVKDRSNAQASCAGHFIEAHLAKDYEGGWLHVDMAGPSSKAERGTGYGVGLILSLLEAPGF